MSSENEKTDTRTAKTPDNLERHIRVMNLNVWLVLTVIIVLLIAVFVWAVFGEIRLTTESGAVELIHPIRFLLN